MTCSLSHGGHQIVEWKLLFWSAAHLTAWLDTEAGSKSHLNLPEPTAKKHIAMEWCGIHQFAYLLKHLNFFFTRLLPFLFHSSGHGGIRNHFLPISCIVYWKVLQPPSSLESYLHGGSSLSISEVCSRAGFPQRPTEHEETQQRCFFLLLNSQFSSTPNSKDNSCSMPVGSSLVLNCLVLLFSLLKVREIFAVMSWRVDLKYMWGVS